MEKDVLVAKEVELEKIDLRSRLARLDGEDVGAIEEELEARLLEDPGFAGELFAAFQAEFDPVRLSFLQNLLASDPEIRNSPAWQDRFMKVAENDAVRERRIAALLFTQQAESIPAVRERMLSLAEYGGELRPYALVALDGIPGRRGQDPRLRALVARMAVHEPDPELRGLAVRIQNDPAAAAGALRDVDPTVRMQACHVVESREILEATLASEKDPEVRETIEARLDLLRSQ